MFIEYTIEDWEKLEFSALDECSTDFGAQESEDGVDDLVVT